MGLGVVLGFLGLVLVLGGRGFGGFAFGGGEFFGFSGLMMVV